MAITLRNQKGSPLTFEEMDGNFTTLSGMTAGGLDIFVTGGTYNDITGDAIFTNNTGGTFTVTGFTAGSGATPSLSDVLSEDNSTGANDISVNEGRKIFTAFDVKGSDSENRIEFGGGGAEFKIISENVDANTGGNEPHQTLIRLSAGELALRAEIKGDGDTIPSVVGNLNLAWIAVEGQNEPIVQMQVDHLLIGGGSGYDQEVKVTMVLPTSSSGLTTNQLWNDNGTVKIVL